MINDRRPTDEPTVSVLQLLDRQISSDLDKVCLSQGGKEVSYGEFDQRVRSVAGLLQSRGVAAGDTVGMLLPRSVDAIVTLFAIMRLQAAYLPLDPKYPTARAAYMLANSEVRTVVTTAGLHGAMAELAEAVDYVLVDEFDTAMTAALPVAALQLPSGDSPAYQIYTSGSTGNPKGVVISHAALLHYISWARDYYVAGQPIDMPLFSSLAFDLTVTSIFLPLVTGGKVVIYPEEEGPSDLSIYSVIKDDQVGMIKLTPSHLAMVGRMDLSGSHVRKLILGGEDLKASLAQKVYRSFDQHIEIYNEYGPTEATVGCMEYQFDAGRDKAGSVPIGRAMAGADILLLDASGERVAAGEAGEIYISSPALALGYVNQPDLTAERFVPHPFSPGQRVYRTGDLARELADGCIEYLGRVDRQVKIGGVRIELEEVESVLHNTPGVHNAAVDVYVPRTGEAEVSYCSRCALPSNYPGVSYDSQGLCNVCREYDEYKDQAQAYFGDENDLRRILQEAQQNRRGDYDCLMLLSGGKDSSYVLFQLLAMGLKVLAYTLDNGYISESAKDNIRRIVAAADVDHIFGSTDAMGDIFRNSLEQFSNVCNGCFKTIYTLSMQVAQEKRIDTIVTGLTRGQMYETRLDFLFRNKVFDIETIERDVARARRVYHTRTDVVDTNLLLAPVSKQAVNDIRFVDFFRYSNVDREDMMQFLEDTGKWERPPDTGRSTNCLINDVGIYIHNRERGFHNYALPYCWDVRLGLLDREEAIRELDTRVNMEVVTDILDTIAYASTNKYGQHEPRLVAYYTADDSVADADLRATAMQQLPASMVPADFVRLDALPLTVNGKVDYAALPAPQQKKAADLGVQVVELARDSIEREVAEIWERVLEVERVGIHDQFFDMGGTSVLAVLVYTQLEDLIDMELPDPDMEQGWTIAEHAELLRAQGYSGN